MRGDNPWIPELIFIFLDTWGFIMANARYRLDSTKQNPLVSFIVMAFNQEKHIREAIEGAFAQTYEPLEIILSDDCSCDGTFKIMQDMKATYDGPNEIVLNRNSVNLGYVGHIDRVMELCKGQLVIPNAGDDVSLPERAMALAKVWQQAPDEVMLIHSPVKLMNDNSEIIGKSTSPQRAIYYPTTVTFGEGTFILGASMAWNRKIFEIFGPLGNGITVEDTIIPFRASLLGRIEYVSEELLKWRIGGASTLLSNRGEVYEYMYGMSHKLRKWRSENALYILNKFDDVSYDGKERVEFACRERYAILQFAVDLAEMPTLRRWRMAPRALLLSIRYRKHLPIKQWTQYAFEPIYLPYAAWRASRRQIIEEQLAETLKDV